MDGLAAIFLPWILAGSLIGGAPAQGAEPAPAAQAPTGGSQGLRGPEPEILRASDRVSVRSLARIRELVHRSLQRLAPELPGPEGPMAPPMSVIIHPSLADLPAEFADDVPEGTPGFALLLAGRIHIMIEEALGVPPDDLATVVDHEVVHLLIQQAASPHGDRVPRWLHEGLAQFLAGGSYYGAREEDIYPGIQSGTLPLVIGYTARMPMEPVPRRLAYAGSHSFVEWLVRNHGMDRLRTVLAAVRNGEEFPAAFVDEYGEPAVELETRWREDVARTGLARFLETNCFSILLVLALPLLVLAVARRLRREFSIRRRLEAVEPDGDNPRGPDGPAGPW